MYLKNKFEILPSKHIPIQNTLLGVGADIIKLLAQPMTISEIWIRFQKIKEIKSFELFVYSLDFLFTISAIDYKDGLIRKNYHA